MSWKEAVWSVFTRGLVKGHEASAAARRQQVKSKKQKGKTDTLSISLPMQDWDAVMIAFKTYSDRHSSFVRHLDPRIPDLMHAFWLLIQDQLQKGLGDPRTVEFNQNEWRNCMNALLPLMPLLEDRPPIKKSVARLTVTIHKGLDLGLFERIWRWWICVLTRQK
jgi:hypothetical protein